MKNVSWYMVAELSSTLAAERRYRQELGGALGELYDRLGLEALEKGERTVEANAKK